MRSLRLLGVCALVAWVFVLAAPAGAHISVNPATAPAGGFTTVAFQVPNEKDDASTVKVEVEFPTDQPIASVSTGPVPGWTVEVEKTTLATPVKTEDGDVTEAVRRITWSGGRIAPGQFQAFPVAMGPLPKADGVTFKAVQTYSNGDVVRWIESQPAGAPEPKNPAPVLELVKEGAASGTVTVVRNDSDNSDTALTIAIVAVVLGGIALVLASAEFFRRRSNKPS